MDEYVARTRTRAMPRYSCIAIIKPMFKDNPRLIRII